MWSCLMVLQWRSGGRQNHWMVLSHCWPAAAWLQHPLHSSSTVVARLMQNMQWREPSSALFVCRVPFRVHRSLLPITQSPIRLIVVRSSTPSPIRHFSCGAWVPPKSDSNCCQYNHLCSAFADTIVVVIASAMNYFVCWVVQPCWCHLLWWRHKGLWPTHLLQWRSQTDQLHCRHNGTFAMMKDHNWCDQSARMEYQIT
jgi:hypothetical protein